MEAQSQGIANQIGTAFVKIVSLQPNDINIVLEEIQEYSKKDFRSMSQGKESKQP